jgi:hypothetical protein
LYICQRKVEANKKNIWTLTPTRLYECLIDVGHRFKKCRNKGKIIFLTPLQHVYTSVVRVSYECRTPTRVGHHDTSNHRDVSAS